MGVRLPQGPGPRPQAPGTRRAEMLGALVHWCIGALGGVPRLPESSLASLVWIREESLMIHFADKIIVL